MPQAMPDTVASSEVLRLRPDVVVTKLESEAVLLDLATKYFYSVNGSGWAVVQLFETGTTTDEAVRQCAEWRGREGAIQDEVGNFIARLIEEGLITAGERAPVGEISGPGPWSAPTLEKHKEPLQKIMVSAFDPTLPLAE